MKLWVRLSFLGLLIGLTMLHGRLAHTIPLANNTDRVSLQSNGSQANDDSYEPDISADGRYIAFASDATNLVSGDSNGARDIFVHDRYTGITERVSVRSNGDQANFDSDAPAISDDGRYVTFYSFATNLVDNDTNNVADIFLHDRQNGKTTLVNIVLNGQANDISYDPDISGNGQFITFWSYANNLVGGDNNFSSDVFRYDHIGKTMFRVSLDSNGVEGNSHSSYPSISQNGRYIAFESLASNLVLGDAIGYRDIFWHDMDTGKTERVSIANDGDEGSGDSFEAAISADGRYVAFTSFANDLTSNDGNAYRDIFVRDTQDDETKRISSVMGGVNTWEEPTISGNGRYVAYIGRPAQSCSDTLCEVFVYDRATDTAVRASVNNNGTAGNEDSYTPVLADNGRYLAFGSKSTNLVPNDTNSSRDIFVRNYLPEPRLSVSFPTAKPGSLMAFKGFYYPADQSAQIQVNGVTIGNATADGDGDVPFRLQTQANTEPGVYVVTVRAGGFSSYTIFRLDNSAPLRPDGGNGPTFNLPNGIALNRYQYLPFVAP